AFVVQAQITQVCAGLISVTDVTGQITFPYTAACVDAEEIAESSGRGGEEPREDQSGAGLFHRVLSDLCKSTDSRGRELCKNWRSRERARGRLVKLQALSAAPAPCRLNAKFVLPVAAAAG